MRERSFIPKVKKGKFRIGIGGWTYEPWRGVFYPKGLPHKRELEFASRRLSSIEINGTYYSTFKPASWAKWREETPEGFVFSVKASRYCTNRKELSGAAESIARFIGQGLSELRDRLGPINWQFMATKKFDPEDFEGFLKLLPREIDGLTLRHALEVRHPSFEDQHFYDLARRYNAAIVFADGDDFPAIDQATADFTYARLMRTREEVETGYAAAELDRWASRAKAWAKRGDVFIYFISGAKLRARRGRGADRAHWVIVRSPCTVYPVRPIDCSTPAGDDDAPFRFSVEHGIGHDACRHSRGPRSPMASGSRASPIPIRFRCSSSPPKAKRCAWPIWI